MKRKRGAKAGKKGKKKKSPSVVNDPSSSGPVTVNTEECKVNFEMDIEPPSLGSEKTSNASCSDNDIPNDRSTSNTKAGRVKVKLRSSNLLEPRLSYSDAAMEKTETAVEKEDSVYSDGQTPETHKSALEKIPRKAGSIKIKSSRALGLSSDPMQDKDPDKITNLPRIPDSEKNVDPCLKQRETKLNRDACFNEKELSASLVVIKKVMKMEAAGPFNAPVNPVALGIPDYFDIIDNPMDFGTICHDLELGSKYMNSEDVYKDVQYIWENCYKYNNKGDYIIDLMKRVKKNFIKYWSAAGLYSDVSSIGGTENTQTGDSHKLPPKSKSKHKRRRYGIDQHKSDCMCAVCVVRRRRKEHDESQLDVPDVNIPPEFRVEERSPVDNPCSDDSASTLDHSPEADAKKDADKSGIERKMETPENHQEIQDDDQGSHQHNASSEVEPLQNLTVIKDGDPEDSGHPSQEREMDSDQLTQPGDKEDDVAAHPHQEEEKKQELGVTSQQIKSIENQKLQENHSILQICSSLFSRDPRSVWCGPHSLSRLRRARVGESSIDAALASFMKH